MRNILQSVSTKIEIMLTTFVKRDWQLGSALLLVGLAGCATVAKNLPNVANPDLHPLPKVEASLASDAASPTRVKLASFEDFEQQGGDDLALTPLKNPSESIVVGKSVETERPAGELGPGVYPIDLANALGLGGADSLQIRLARTRLYQARARHFEAKTLWLPSLRLGVGYNKHDGRLQETEGDVLEINRNSLFYGGGLGLGGVPLPGGAGGPPRLFVNLSLADAYFKPLSACQEVAAFGAAGRAATNDSLAEIAYAYHSLLEAHGRLANNSAARDLAENMVSLVENFEREGFSSMAEVQRTRANLGHWQQEEADAERETMVRSAELARLLRLPQQVQLAPAEDFIIPVDFVDASMEVDAMIAMAHRGRPEVSQYRALREAACFRVKEEEWRPWIPHVQVGASAGGFGGGPSTAFPSAAGRSDVDLLAVWEWKNLGLGNVALQRQRRGELHERLLELEDLRDKIAMEVATAAADVASYRRQMEIAQQEITAAEASYRLNEQRIRESEGLPIELLQSITALTDARNAYTELVANYNRAQYRLLRAMGNPAGVPSDFAETDSDFEPRPELFPDDKL